MIEVRTTFIFDRWLDKLRDRRARVKIAAPTDRIRGGNFGDWKPISSGVCELRLTYGPGYRLYYVQPKAREVVMLCGGGKDTQSRDIVRAKKIAAHLDIYLE